MKKHFHLISTAALILGQFNIGLVLLSSCSLAVAEQQLSREAYVEMTHADLLAPCHNAGFVACLGSSEQQCLSQVNQLVESCSRNLPATITSKNFDATADDYANCVFAGLQQKFGKTSEQIGQCETQAGLR